MVRAPPTNYAALVRSSLFSFFLRLGIFSEDWPDRSPRPKYSPVLLDPKGMQ